MTPFEPACRASSLRNQLGYAECEPPPSVSDGPPPIPVALLVWRLQEQGLDTVDANRALGLPDDCREYTSVRNILRDLHVQSIQLMVSNDGGGGGRMGAG